MQKTVYYCDQCNKVIGDVVHISLVIHQEYSGLAVPPEIAVLSRWTVDKLPNKFIHFHLNCIEKYFSKMAKLYLPK